MATKVKCAACGHAAQIENPSDVWQCNCGVDVGPKDCECRAVNGYDEPVEDNPPSEAGTIAELRRQLDEAEAREAIRLGGATAPTGELTTEVIKGEGEGRDQ
jgi:hypothetical protein